ncbi:MAG TPA: serine/threonine-protein kinase [Gemmatimonadaceae bacterium]|nr:serine/threonine-protein kinase [Gemmatimonadaceae bacterium]
MVTIHTLGGLSLRGVVGFDETAPDNRRAMALLALLAIAGERGVDPDRARELLGLSDTQPAGLTVVEDVIRTALGPGAIRTDHALHVNLAVVRADVAEFERALDDRDARTAVALYTGPFLGGFSLAETPAFDRWALRERERLERRLHRAQAMLALRNTPTGRTAGMPVLTRPASATPRSQAALDTSSAPAASRERGAIIGGRYRVLGELGRGAMASVLLARDIKHERDVAIKFVRSDAADANALARFQREIALVASLQHPHILPLYDSGESGGSLYYVMPYISGQSLRERLDAEHALPLGEALRIAREAGDALAHAHDHGVIHRDVKPANILLSGGHALVGDFGIARGAPRAAGRRLTDDGYAVGTPAYMSPEQACGDPVDARSDEYSLACVLFEMLAGAPPFTGGRGQSALAQRFLGDAPPLGEKRPDVPAPVARAVATALARSPSDRFTGVAEFLAAFDSAAPATGVAAATRFSRVRRWFGRSLP